MIEMTVWGVPCRINLLFPALVTYLLFVQPNGLAVCCVCASLVHEIGHLTAMRLTGIRPKDCTLGLFGMRIHLQSSLSRYGKNAIVAAAGPLANGLAAAILWWAGSRQAALVHMLLASLNLLPVSILDGGELLRCALSAVGYCDGGEAALAFISGIAVVLLIIGACVLVFIGRGNVSMLIVALYPAGMWFFEKIAKTS